MRHLLPLLLVLCATACALSPSGDGESTSADTKFPLGMDSFDAPSGAILANQGYKFASRYLAPAGNPKNLTAAQVQDLFRAGISIVANWEEDAYNALGGRAAGIRDAQTADAEVTAVGLTGAVIYFSVDFDALDTQKQAILDYFAGVASVIGYERTGAYAGYKELGWLFDQRPSSITFGWQTASWSYGQWDSRAALRQITFDSTAGGVHADIDQARVPYFGQSSPTPPPSYNCPSVRGPC